MNTAFDIYKGKRVLVTGHTGFKGAWLTQWLLTLGAKVTGAALPPPTSPSLFNQLRLDADIEHRLGDIRDRDFVSQVVATSQPDFIFHLAAQPLVRLSYREPVETLSTNIMGTAHVLDAARQMEKNCAVVSITTDKCYENKEWVHSYREEDPVGGHDPYSASKGAAEIVIAAYRRSFFSHVENPVKLASARAGNVIGGGDWADDRIVPDSIRALARGEIIPVRNKISTRPWQHVLEPLSGYLTLGARLYQTPKNDASFSRYASAFNFGPPLSSNKTVADLVQEILRHWPGEWSDRSDQHAVHEATLLNLATDKAHHILHWQSRWDFPTTVRKTIEWYRDASSLSEPGDYQRLTISQIQDYAETATASF
ncbi:CDP-glucose 4,6-dehydratase [Terrimicrobium sacchariphilum]|uniref:CDP-glucose 4,6-dehydratase n=1 Tax=Terrimicrobium sacchariphilum TaxID=690879 RepID=A0A146G407_TERSA|nr:CDP-glucose 4,6-dehydratase [Terrimicrobium sacchariphilum]GAT31767.1 CDP-glucose 4,6-dehydratase [Terrimicrobium sacchariphilum]